MLSSLRIENVAVIEKAEIEFTPGFCVLTGETGAGKSILIDSLSAVLGSRTSKDIVRRGSDKAVISALFENCSSKVMEQVEEMGFPAEDNSVLLGRVITADGRSTCRINGMPANAAILRQLAVLLINIHGQQDNHSLLDPAAHSAFVDKLLPDASVVFRYRKAYEHWKNLMRQYEQLQMDEADKARRIDMLRYQVDELESADLQPGEYEQLLSQKKAAANSEKIAEAIAAVIGLLGGDDMQAGGVDLVQNAAGHLSECASYLAVDELDERLQSLGYELEAVYDEIRTLADDLVFDPRELAQLEERLDVLYRLTRKYGNSEEEMLAFLEKARDELALLEQSEETCRSLEEEIAKAKTEAVSAANALTEARKQAASVLDQAVCDELQFLNMPDVIFCTQFTPCELSAAGCEKIEFLISANGGEPPKPLSRIASGGELSRIMLAIISVLTRQDEVATLIFDEIDTGISGRAALKVGNRLQKTAADHQVICITHLAQIAAKADTHYLIEKQIKQQRAVTSVTQLTGEERLRELARIIGGETVTQASLQTARELINGNE